MGGDNPQQPTVIGLAQLLTLQIGDLLRREMAAGEAHGVAPRAPRSHLHIQPHLAASCLERVGGETGNRAGRVSDWNRRASALMEGGAAAKSHPSHAAPLSSAQHL